MFARFLGFIPSAGWPWGPPGADMSDVLFAYGAIVVIGALVVWNASNQSTPPPAK